MSIFAISFFCEIKGGAVLSFSHKPVLLEQTVDSLNIKPDGIYLDGTAGGGGVEFLGN